MKQDRVKRTVGRTPHMTPPQAEKIQKLITGYQLKNILELGFRHGVSTCYLAAAVHELGGGHVTTVDLESARDATPNVEGLLTELGLRDFVTVHYEPTSYNWRLMKLLEQNETPLFDLCYLDGAHDWFVDGFAFFLVDRLLMPEGWIVFDDLDWTYSASPSLKGKAEVVAMPREEREIPQIRKVYELLVKRHPHYQSFSEQDGWAYAQKSPSAGSSVNRLKTEIVYQKVGLGSALLRLIESIRRAL